MYLLTVARQRLGKNVTATTNTHTREELLEVSFSIWPVSYQMKVSDQFIPELLLSIHIRFIFIRIRILNGNNAYVCSSAMSVISTV
jgi:hypothetical protein